MQYFSTRGHSSRLDSAEAILKGLAPDGGLFVPESLPQIDKKFITALQPLSYEERAEKVLGLFLTDYTADELRGCVARAYGGGKFDSERRAPVVTLSDASVLELWHGPTSAFKDMALQLLP
ncbi:MAG: threonine synthase, partial [Selenomonadaceae bacterium]|nr:threonine synthase [Selenomonadaceae bacterium]